MRSTVDEETDAGASQADDFPPTEGFGRSMQTLSEVREYLGYYLAAKADSYRASFRKLAVLLVAGVLALAVGLTLVVVATVLLCVGVAQGLSGLMGHHPWAGNLVVGGGMLLILFAGILLGSRMLARAAHQRTVKKYELRQEQQRREHGRTVTERAAAAGQVSE